MPLLFGLILFLWPGRPSAPEVAHDFHISYGHMAVEKNVVVCRIRFFQDDLEAALRHYGGHDAFRMAASPQVDSLFAAYFAEHFALEVDGKALAGRIIGSGQDAVDREPVWWYMVQFEAPAPIQKLRLRNTLLFDLFDDQKHVFKVVHFPEETQRSYYFAKGEEAFDVAF